MIKAFRWLINNLGTLIMAIVLAFAVWISAVTETDPIEERLYPRAIQIEFIGQDPDLILTASDVQNVNLTLRAPQSIWDRLINEQMPIRALVDLSALEAGAHSLPVQIQVGVRPAEVVSYTPRSVDIVLENLSVHSLPIVLVERGAPAVGYQAESPEIDPEETVISGPESVINRVQELRVVLDLNRATEDIDVSLPILAVDANDTIVSGLTIAPDRVDASVTVTQRGGFRNVVVKVVTSGQIATGYRVTNISVFPPAVTVFSADPKLVDDLPGYVETSVLDLTGAKDDIDIGLPLALPEGVTLVGEQLVQVQVGIAAIEGSLTLPNLKVSAIGTGSGFNATLSPQTVDVIVSGPLPNLEALLKNDVQVVVDLTDLEPGSYQIEPTVEVGDPDLRVESIIPASIEVVIARSTGSP
ncbi:MAG: hypothetical protein HPY76_00765 [Anaerolineae bacterium]|nr:hypothetical protein [Anaerolineae bacterium]